MALVSEKVYSRWFVEGHPIYENFKYIFQNPLWHKERLPTGFSLCPYFWLSWLLGFLFLKMFFVPSMQLLALLCKLGGKPVVWFDNGLKAIWRFVWRKLDDTAESDAIYKRVLTKGGLRGGGMMITFMALVILAVIGVVAAAIIWAFSIAIKLYILNFITSKVANTVTGVVLSGIVLAIVLGRYEHIHKYSDNKCNVKVYFYIWALLSVISICVVDPHHVWICVLTLWTLLKLCIWGIFHYGWIALSYIGKFFVVIWILIKSLVLGIVNHIVGILYTFGVMAILAMIGYLAGKLADKMSYTQIKDPADNTLLKPRMSTLYDWKMYIIYLIQQGERWHIDSWASTLQKGISKKLLNAVSGSDQVKIYRVFERSLLTDLVDEYLKLPEFLTSVSHKGFMKFQDYHEKKREQIELDGFISDFEAFFTNINPAFIKELEHSLVPFKAFLREEQEIEKVSVEDAVSRYFKKYAKDAEQMFECRIAQIKEEEKAKQKKSERRLRMEKWCQNTTKAIQSFFRLLYMFTIYPFWWIFKQFNIMMGKLFTHIGRTIMAIWILIKAAKHGVCPYVQFMSKEELARREKAEQEKKKEAKPSK